MPKIDRDINKPIIFWICTNTSIVLMSRKKNRIVTLWINNKTSTSGKILIKYVNKNNQAAFMSMSQLNPQNSAIKKEKKSIMKNHWRKSLRKMIYSNLKRWTHRKIGVVVGKLLRATIATKYRIMIIRKVFPNSSIAHIKPEWISSNQMITWKISINWQKTVSQNQIESVKVRVSQNFHWGHRGKWAKYQPEIDEKITKHWLFYFMIEYFWNMFCIHKISLYL